MNEATIEKLSVQYETNADAVAKKVSKLQQTLNAINKKLFSSGEGAEKSSKSFSKAGEKLKDTLGSIKKGFNGLNNKTKDFFGSLGSFTPLRLAKLMLIRSAIRAIGKAMGEGLGNYYQYIKATNQLNTSTAGVLDKIKNLGMSFTNNLGVTFSNLIASLYPLIQKLLTLIDNFVVKLNMLIAIMSGKKTIDRAKTGMYEYAKAVQTAKNSLMGFDELNQLQDSTSGGGVDPSTMFESIEIPQEYIEATAKLREVLSTLKEALFNPLTMGGLGLLFIATGHWLLGLGCIVASGYLMGKELADNGHLLPQSVRDFFSTLASSIYTPIALGGIGAALLLTGHWKLGLGCIVGAGILVAHQISESNYISEALQEKLRAISSAVSMASIAIGAILCLFGISTPLGFGLLAAGCVGLANSLPGNDNTYTEIKNKITRIGAIVGGALLALGAILCLTGVAVPLGLGLLAVGGVTLATSIAPNWNYFVDKVKEVVRKVKEAIKIPKFTITGSFSLLPPSVPKFGLEMVSLYAKGGFPSVGDLFIANEAGPEMVGSMGNRNVVANNMQIIEGIKQGVMEAMQSVNVAPTIEFTYKCDSEVLYKTVKKGERSYNGRYVVGA